MAEVLSICAWDGCPELVVDVQCEHHKKRKRSKPPKKTNHRNVPKMLRKRVLTRDNNQCRMCGTPDDLTLDHKVPVSQGGKATYENLQTLCRTCHNIKEGMGPHNGSKEE